MDALDQQLMFEVLRRRAPEFSDQEAQDLAGRILRAIDRSREARGAIDALLARLDRAARRRQALAAGSEYWHG